MQIVSGDSYTAPTYNITACCAAASVLPQCMPLCSYDIKVSDLQLLGHACSLQMGKKLSWLAKWPNTVRTVLV